jgi:hypothetical protein
MTYVFDSTTGATFAQLQALVLTNAFGATKYTEFSKTFLNDAVTEACRRLRLQRTYWILGHGADGEVVMPTYPFWLVEEVWRAASTATSSVSPVSAQLFMQSVTDKLEPNPSQSPAALDGYNVPAFYMARRAASPVTRYPQIALTVVPAAAEGRVAVAGLVRPPVMVTDGDTTGLGADLDWAVVCWTRARLFALEDDPEMQAFMTAQFEDGVRSAGVAVVADGPAVTPGTWEDGFVADKGR